MKGIMQTLEGVIAVTMILTIIIVFYGPKQQLPDFTTITWKLRGFESLKALDTSNELRPDVMVNNTASIEAKLAAMVPADIDYTVVVCKSSCGKPDIDADKIVSVTYLIAGRMGNIESRQVILYMW